MKKSVLITLAIIAVLILSAGCVYAGSQIARVNAIGEETALKFACTDAGALPSDAKLIHTGFEYKNGTYVYDIAFEVNGSRYEYTVDSYNGLILETKREALTGITQPADMQQRRVKSSERKAKGSTWPESEARAEGTIGIDRARGIALDAAGFTTENVTFSKAKLKRDDGRVFYEIEFYVSGETEYEYEIDAYTGEISDEDIESWDDD